MNPGYAPNLENLPSNELWDLWVGRQNYLAPKLWRRDIEREMKNLFDWVVRWKDTYPKQANERAEMYFALEEKLGKGPSYEELVAIAIRYGIAASHMESGEQQRELMKEFDNEQR